MILKKPPEINGWKMTTTRVRFNQQQQQKKIPMGTFCDCHISELLSGYSVTHSFVLLLSIYIIQRWETQGVIKRKKSQSPPTAKKIPSM